MPSCSKGSQTSHRGNNHSVNHSCFHWIEPEISEHTTGMEKPVSKQNQWQLMMGQMLQLHVAGRATKGRTQTSFIVLGIYWGCWGVEFTCSHDWHFWHHCCWSCKLSFFPVFFSRFTILCLNLLCINVSEMLSESVGGCWLWTSEVQENRVRHKDISYGHQLDCFRVSTEEWFLWHMGEQIINKGILQLLGIEVGKGLDLPLWLQYSKSYTLFWMVN